MKLSELKSALAQADQINFVLPNGEQVPSHFHVTEVGSIQKHFIDCGGTIRKEAIISLQLLAAADYDHRLPAQKLKSIINLSETRLGLEDGEVEVEYQGDTIGKYGLNYDGMHFQLTSKQTSCLANDRCGAPGGKASNLSAVNPDKNKAPVPVSGCC